MTGIVSVVAGGWSLRELGVEGRDRIPGFRIGVNDSMRLLRCDAGVSMDRLWLEHRVPTLKDPPQTVWARRTALVNLSPQPAYLRAFDCDHETSELADKAGWLNGPNSGHCALNLAYKMRPATIVLWGFDMNRSPKGEPYWYKPYEWAKAQPGTPAAIYGGWAAGMGAAAAACARKKIRLLNASLVSAIEDIERIDPWALLT